LKFRRDNDYESEDEIQDVDSQEKGQRPKPLNTEKYSKVEEVKSSGGGGTTVFRSIMGRSLEH